MDEHGIQAISRIRGDAVLSRILGEFLRWKALRHEGGIAAHGGLHAAAVVPQLVPTTLSLCIRNVPLRRGLNPSNPGPREPLMLTYQTLPVRHVSEFAAAVREGLLKPGQRELPSKYLYNELGPPFSQALCPFPHYDITRAC